MGEERDRDIVFSFGDEKALGAQACRRFEHLAAEAIGDHGRFTVALAGGSSPKPLYSALARSESVDWDNVVLVPGDERMVSTTSSYSNTQMFRKTLLDHLEKQPRYVAPPTSLFSAYEAARKWEEQLRMESSNESSVDELARFDLVLLGLGADGHTASLFPSDKNTQWR